MDIKLLLMDINLCVQEVREASTYVMPCPPVEVRGQFCAVSPKLVLPFSLCMDRFQGLNSGP